MDFSSLILLFAALLCVALKDAEASKIRIGVTAVSYFAYAVVLPYFNPSALIDLTGVAFIVGVGINNTNYFYERTIRSTVGRLC